MGLEMKVYKEISGYEAKAMFGFTWRQLGALVVMITLGGGIFAGVTFMLMGFGQTTQEATSVAMYCMFPILVPAAAWGWWRPKGLKPERFLGFFLRYQLMKRTIRYEDTQRTTTRSAMAAVPAPASEHAGISAGHLSTGGAVDESVEPAQLPSTRGRVASARKLRKTLSEHPRPQKK